ncbi:PREDICTED: cytochrome P450 3A29-like [Branchiostoma belcheri]|uniref:Cytochrome P450 3A29-like n=1 Tax=Branchiostoma belcheri TaxID=7741 RepID=A0A6P5AEZ2_BRABE|nr:PREDICTED: cytochrome P450 3A29-like [Branchiostoma belcheri]
MLDLLPLSPTWVLAGLFAVLSYWFLVWPFSTFKKLGIPGPKPVPLFGNYLGYRKGMGNFDQECYQKYNKVYGFFEGQQPILMVGDLKLVREITVKKTNIFQNRRDLAGRGEIFGASVAALKDDDWKRVRGVISPTFSTGKLKQMSPHLERCAANFISKLDENCQDGTVFDMKKLTGAFSLDVTSSTAFGVDVDSLNNPDNPLVWSAKNMFDFSFYNPLVLIVILFPQLAWILEFCGVNFMNKKSITYFSDAVDHAINMKREVSDKERPPDFLQLALAAHNEELDNGVSANTAKWGISKKEIKGNAVLFWAAGYESTSNTIALTAYNLALHQEAQDRCIEEIDAVIKKHGVLDYKAIHELPYLEMCINETLRIFPSTTRIDRVAKEDVDLDGIRIPAGMLVFVPVWSIHMDADIWPEPEEFRPERFSKEAVAARDPYAYLPFGSGPRNCAGMRLSLLELRFSLAKALEKFRFVTCKETVIPVRFKKSMLNQIDHEVWLKVEARTPTHA